MHRKPRLIVRKLTNFARKEAIKIGGMRRSWNSKRGYIEILPGEPSNPSWSEQDRAAQLFLAGAYRAALSTEPELVSDIQAEVSKLRNVAKTLRQLAAELQSVENFLTEIYAEHTAEIAAECDDDANVMTTSPTTRSLADYPEARRSAA